MTDYLPDSEKCVVLSVSFLEMTKDTAATQKIIEEMRKNGTYVVLALRNKKDHYKLLPTSLPFEMFDEVQDMITLANPEDYSVLAHKNENDEPKSEFNSKNMYLLDKYKACQNAVTEYGGTAIDIGSGGIKDVHKALKEYKLL